MGGDARDGQARDVSRREGLRQFRADVSGLIADPFTWADPTAEIPGSIETWVATLRKDGVIDTALGRSQLASLCGCGLSERGPAFAVLVPQAVTARPLPFPFREACACVPREPRRRRGIIPMQDVVGALSSKI